MSLIKNAAVRDHLSAPRRQIVFPFAPASQAEAAGCPGDEPRQARISNAHRQSGQARSSGTASINPIRVLMNSDGPVHIDSQKVTDVTPHAMFLRVGCILPDGLDLAQEHFCKEWMCVEDTMAAALDTKVRNAGWHFMWLHSSYSA
jgi:hypothetical protein